MKIKKVRVSYDVIKSALTHGVTHLVKIVENPLPEDAVLVNVIDNKNDLSLIYKSEQFEDVPFGAPLPVYQQVFENIQVEATREKTL